MAVLDEAIVSKRVRYTAIVYSKAKVLRMLFCICHLETSKPSTTVEMLNFVNEKWVWHVALIAQVEYQLQKVNKLLQYVYL